MCRALTTGSSPMDPKHYLGAACPHGHTWRYVSTGQCVDCHRSHVRASRQRAGDRETPVAVEARRTKARDRYLRERDKRVAYQRRRQKNVTREQRKKSPAAKREWYCRNRDTAIEQHKRWKASNPDKVRRQACIDAARFRERFPRRRKRIKDAWVIGTEKGSMPITGHGSRPILMWRGVRKSVGRRGLRLLLALIRHRRSCALCDFQPWANYAAAAAR
jgi:hypothetical protein